MQPELNRPQVGPEQLPMPPANVGEHIQELPSVEAGIETGAERVEQAAEASAAASNMAAAQYAAPVQAVPVADPSVTPVADDHPVVAADEDVIEKEWVDKAKKIVEETKGDPFTRSSRVSDMQRDYLQKRYGKVIGADE